MLAPFKVFVESQAGKLRTLIGIEDLGYCRSGRFACSVAISKSASYRVSTASTPDTGFCGGQSMISTNTGSHCASGPVEGSSSRIGLGSPDLWQVKKHLIRLHIRSADVRRSLVFGRWQIGARPSCKVIFQPIRARWRPTRPSICRADRRPGHLLRAASTASPMNCSSMATHQFRNVASALFRCVRIPFNDLVGSNDERLYSRTIAAFIGAADPGQGVNMPGQRSSSNAADLCRRDGTACRR